MFLPIEPSEVPNCPCEVVKHNICPSSMGWPSMCSHLSLCHHCQQAWNKSVLRFRNQDNAAHTTKFLLRHIIKPSYKSD